VSSILDASLAHAAPWVWPLPMLGDLSPVISQDWRPFDDDDPHLGADLMYRLAAVGRVRPEHKVPEGTSVLAAGAGIVRFAGDTPRGLAVILDHSGGRATYYVHLSALFVIRGAVVEPGQPLGLVGHDPMDGHRIRHLHFEVWLHGTRSSATDPRRFLATWPRLRYVADGARNAGWWAVKTPGVIKAELDLTNQDVLALGRDIRAAFRRPFETELEKALARFKAERGRAPGIGKDSDSGAEWRTVFGWMSPEPSAEDQQWKTYQGRFVHEWGEFEREWEGFFNSHSRWHQRMWRGTYDQALDYRKRAKLWREKFQTFGGTPSTPEPQIPTEGGPLGDLDWKTFAWVAGGVAAVALAGPPLVRALRKEGPS
jgi:hypothetical protein